MTEPQQTITPGEKTYAQLVAERRSVRGYLPKPVPREVIEEVVALAKYSPSSMNTQPWHLHVLTGDVLDAVRKGNTEKILGGAKIDREIRMNHGYEGKHRERQIEIAVQLFEAMGIAKDDKAGKQDWALRGFRQFDAPVSIVVTVDKELAEDTIGHFDCGAVTYGLVLAAWSKGLGSVINGQGITQSSVVRELANIPDNEVIMTCVAMGYPDDTFVANHVRSRRASDDTVVSWVGWD